MSKRRTLETPQFKAKATLVLGALRVLKTTAEVPDRAEVHPPHDCRRKVGVAQKCRRTLTCGQASKKPTNTQIGERSRQIGQFKAENDFLLEPIAKKSFGPIHQRRKNFGVGRAFRVREIPMYSCGSKLAAALIWNQNPNFAEGSKKTRCLSRNQRPTLSLSALKVWLNGFACRCSLRLGEG